MNQKINASRFYYEWRGHTIPDITAFHAITRSERPDKPVIFLAGDSSLDNKYWVPGSGPGGERLPVDVPDIYRTILSRPTPKPDVAFWLNHFLGSNATTLNLAVEESTLKERQDELLEHDMFIRDNIRTDDVLVVSIGANDIALKPAFSTIRHMLQLAWLTPRAFLERGSAWSLSHFVDMFKDKIEAYVSRLVEKCKPRAVIVCMIYYPLEARSSNQSSWADLPLMLLGYNRFPRQLQAAIRALYELATKKIEIQGTTVVACPFFEVMDGKKEEYYSDRVEPSVEGGRKMSLQLKHIIDPLIAAPT